MKRRNRVTPAKGRVIEFEIDHIDPLGQGVSKAGGSVTFIAATLPGETGTARVYKRAKGVQFARLVQLEQHAENRTEPYCPHFDKCPGCQFLHTDYDSELGYKKAALVRYLGPLGVADESVEVVPAPHRLDYRNRVQLHYRHKYIGMLDAVSNDVLPIPDCKIVRPELRPVLDQLYQGGWTQSHAGHGHCELYLKSGEVSICWDEAYAHGGFSQVFEAMNQQLQARVQDRLAEAGTSRLLDLFSGSGNLSDAYALAGGERTLVDRYVDAVTTNVQQIDLYDDQALAFFTRRAGATGFDTLLLDPPRRGFPALNSWVNRIKPRHVLYVSCNPASLTRDLRSLSRRFRIKSVHLLDLFPATAHFETMVLLEMRQART